MKLIDRGEAWEVYQANCLDESHARAVMGKRKADLICLDAPYSEITHSGHDRQVASLKDSFATNVVGGRRTREQAYAARVSAGKSAGRRAIDYPFWTEADVQTFCAIWLPLCSGWVVTITDHVLAAAWGAAFAAHDRLVFPPLPLMETGSRVRMSGDGPSNWTCWLIVARPRSKEFVSWGTLRGGYVVPGEREINATGGTDRVVGGKPLLAMQCIVDDYSRRGGLVVDPTSGGGTTLRAALGTGRRCIGIEQDAGRAELSAKACRAVNIGQAEMFQ